MNREDLLPAHITGLWFMIAAFLFGLLFGDYGTELNILYITVGGVVVAVIANLWNIYTVKNGKMMDERKQKLVTEAMAWGFVTTVTAGILAAKTLKNPRPEIFQDIVLIGVCTWLIAFIGKNIRQNDRKLIKDVWEAGKDE